MTAQVTNYKCPACTGPLHFAGGSGKLECEFCGASYDVAEMEALYAGKEAAAAEAAAVTEGKTEWEYSSAGSDWSAEELSHMRAYKCPSCSAELVCDDTTAATSCPYCGNQTVIPGQFTGMLKPDYVIPFKLDKDAAIAALKKHYTGKKFLPKTFRSDNHIAEIKGVYVPFWLFDAHADADLVMRGTKAHTRRSGDVEITTTEHYRIRRQGDMSFEKTPVDGSTKMPDALMDAIEPFDYTALTPFSSAYLPGFLADKYDVDADACRERANKRITKSAEDALENTITGYRSLMPERFNVQIKNGDVKYALLPVWTLATKWGGKDFLFAMNGQSGKLIGDLPVDKHLYWSWFVRIALIAAVVLAALLFLTPMAFAADLDLVYDEAGLLTTAEWSELEERAAAISEEYACDVVVVTVDRMTDDDGAYDWAWFVFDNYNYGFGEDKSGVMLFLSMEKRDYALVAQGYGNTAFTDYGKDEMLDEHILPLLGEDKYYEAFSAYLDQSEIYLRMARSGAPFDVDTDPSLLLGILIIKLAAIILLPFLTAIIVCSVWKSKHKSAVVKREASRYIADGSFRLAVADDIFLYKNETRRVIEPKTSSSSSSYSGGTTTDSRGRSGRSGKF